MTNKKKKRRLLAILDEITLSSDDIENSYQHYSNLKRNYELEFENKTKLNELDIKILFLFQIIVLDLKVLLMEIKYLIL